MQHHLWHMNRHRRVTWGLALEKMTGHGFYLYAALCPKAWHSLATAVSMDRTLNGFWLCFPEESGHWGGGGPSAPPTRLCPLPIPRSSWAESLPQPRKATPWGGQPAGPSSRALVSAKRSCPYFRAVQVGGVHPGPHLKPWPWHGGLTLAEPSELVNTLLPTGDLHVSAPEAASHLLLHLCVDLLRVQLHLPLELLQRGVRLLHLQPLPLAHPGQPLLLLPGEATRATELTHNQRTGFDQRTSFHPLSSADQISISSIQML